VTLHLSTAQLDRAAGSLVAMGCGDALGARFEFGPALGRDVDLSMKASATWERGEWTDDTSMAVAIAEVSADGADLLSPAAQDRIAARWATWAPGAKDVGILTGAVLRGASRAAARKAAERGYDRPTAADCVAAAARYDEDHHHKSAGNGSLMRTAPVALAYLDDPHGLVKAATELSAMTHADPEAGEACVLWCLAIRHAVLHASFDGLRKGLGYLPGDRATVWADRLDEAERNDPSRFGHNGWVVQALQGAWSAIHTTQIPDGDPSQRFPAAHLRRGLEAAVRGGKDTDTVAAIAGQLLGARWGVSAVPSTWRRALHGWPGLRADDLVRLGVLTARSGKPDNEGWPSGAHVDYGTWGDSRTLVRHPHDDRVWLSGVGHLARVPDGVDAVVSLCRLGTDDIPGEGVAVGDHVQMWLVDSVDPTKNPNLDYVLDDAASAVKSLREEQKTVLLHCVQAQSRTPTVAALYGAKVTGRSPRDALDDVQRALPKAHPNPAMLAALDRLS